MCNNVIFQWINFERNTGSSLRVYRIGIMDGTGFIGNLMNFIFEFFNQHCWFHYLYLTILK
jgi:hypothetical protein